MMKRRIPVAILISMLLTQVLTTCAGAVEAKITASDGAESEYLGRFVSISGNETLLCNNF